MSAVSAARRTLAALAAVCACGVLPAGAGEPAFPNGPVRMLVAFPPGGGTDIVARIVAERLAEAWRQPVIVDNRAGAGGVIGTEVAARAAPDGHTILMATLGNLSVNPHLYPMNIDPLRDLAPISGVVAVNFVLVANPRLETGSVEELVTLARERPGEVHYASSGVGGAPHLAGELFNGLAGVRLQHVPYKGSGESVRDVLGGQVPLTFDSLVQVLPHIEAGRLRALAVLGPDRSPLLPDVPTLAEAGLPGYEVVNWFGLVAPSGTPPAVVERINADVAAVLRDPAVRERLAQMGADVLEQTPAEFADQIRRDSEKWSRVIQEADIRAP